MYIAGADICNRQSQYGPIAPFAMEVLFVKLWKALSPQTLYLIEIETKPQPTDVRLSLRETSGMDFV